MTQPDLFAEPPSSDEPPSLLKLTHYQAKESLLQANPQLESYESFYHHAQG